MKPSSSISDLCVLFAASASPTLGKACFGIDPQAAVSTTTLHAARLGTGSSLTASVYRETPKKYSHAVARKASKLASKKSMSHDTVQSYMSTKDEGGDPVTAVGTRPDSPSKSRAHRKAKVVGKVKSALEKLNETSMSDSLQFPEYGIVLDDEDCYGET
ncbi:hypothetical protein PG988_004457 [Apiospora saccharicola]